MNIKVTLDASISLISGDYSLAKIPLKINTYGDICSITSGTYPNYMIYDKAGETYVFIIQ